MSRFTTFALAGVGNIGRVIANELLERKAAGKAQRVVILTRSSADAEKDEEFRRKGGEVITVDYASKASLVSALSGVEVVISTINRTGLESQLPLIDAAKEAGAKLFLPSEFGTPVDHTNGPSSPKILSRKQLKTLNLPYALVFNGAFADLLFGEWSGIDPVGGKATVGGSGNEPISFTASVDVARYLAYVLTELPADKLEWRQFAIEGERASFNEVFEQYTAKTGKKVEVSYRSIPEIETSIEKNPGDVRGHLLLMFARGDGIVGKEEDVTNGEFPNWNPKTVTDILAP